MSWRRFFERGRRDEELARELEAHLALEVDELVARGVPTEEARARAARKLGNRTLLREAVYERNSLVAVDAWLGDLRHGLRQFRRNPLFTTVALLSLALGMGANTAIFSLVDQSLLRTLPVRDPQELVSLHQPGHLQGSQDTDEPGGPSFSYPLFRGLQKSLVPFTGVAGARSIPASLAYGREAAAMGLARRVSGNYFDVLGVRPALGRLLTPADDETPGAHPVVVLGHRYWVRQAGSDPAVLGKTVMVNGSAMTIVGVTPPGFRSERGNESPDVFVPLTMNAQMVPGWKGFEDRRHHWVTLFARLKPGVTMARAETDAGAVYRAEVERDIAAIRLGQKNTELYRARRLLLKPAARGRGGPSSDERAQLWLLMGLTSLVLLIACANLASLQLGRALARLRETSVRLALGASRWALIRQLLVESCLLALGGGALGLLVARWVLPAVAALAPGAPEDFLAVHLDPRVLSFSFTLSLAIGVLFGLFPALQASRADITGALKDAAGRASASPAATRFRLGVVTGQIALSLLLLVSAGLFTRAFVAVTRADLGIRVDGLLTFSVQPQLNRYDDARATVFYRELEQCLAAQPGVRSVTMASVPSIAGTASGNNITVRGFVAADEEAAHSNRNAVGPGYFRTLGIRLVAGREFNATDVGGAPKVAVVNEAFARHFLTGKEALGERFALGQGRETRPDIEIVGVVTDARYSEVDQAPVPVFFLPDAQSEPGTRHFYLRTDLPAEQLAAAVRSEVAALDPNVPIRGLKTLRTQVDERLFESRAMTAVTSSFGVVATLLAGLGLYGVLAYSVSRRTREIGIRIALGANGSEVRRLLVREAALLFAAGGTLGVLGAAGLGRMVQGVIRHVHPWDPAVYASAVALLGVVALAATCAPARRAASINPVVALRQD